MVNDLGKGMWLWLGGYREPDGSGPWDWKWADGSDWTYENWQAGHPDNYHENETAVLLTPPGPWIDGPGIDQWHNSFVCEFEIPLCASGWTEFEVLAVFVIRHNNM